MIGNEERARILRMVSEGQLTPTEAEELLAALDTPPAREASTVAVAPPPRPMPPTPPSSRTLVINISDGDKSKVNVRIPLGLARAASRFIPRQAHQHLAEHDIDLEQLLDSLGSVGGNGTLMEVRDGDDTVLIAVEG